MRQSRQSRPQRLAARWSVLPVVASIALALVLVGAARGDAAIASSTAAWIVQKPPASLPETTPSGDVFLRNTQGESVGGLSNLMRLTPAGSLVWQLPPTEPTRPIYPSATDAQGNTYVGVVDGDGLNYFESFDSSGTKRWTTSSLGTGCCGFVPALGWNGNVYIFRLVYPGPVAHVLGFDTATGAQTLDLPVGSLYALFAYPDGLIVVNSGGIVEYYSYHGELLAQVYGGSAVSLSAGSAASGGNGKVFLGGYSSYDACFTARQPNVVEITPAGVQWTWTGPPDLNCGLDLAATPDGGVILMSFRSNVYFSISAEGTTRWMYAPSPPVPSNVTARPPVVDSTGSVAVPFSFGLYNEGGVEVDFLSQESSSFSRPPITIESTSCTAYPAGNFFFTGADLGPDQFYLGLATRSCDGSQVSGQLDAFSEAGLTQNYRLVLATPPSPSPAPTSLVLTPKSGSDPVGASHTLTAQVAQGTTPLPAINVNFVVTSGPCQGRGGTGTTGSNGNASFTYSCSKAGTDTITATSTVGPTTLTDSATEQWINPACRGIYLVGARGLGETNNDYNGYGKTIAFAVSAFRNHYTGGPVAAHFLDYKTNSLLPLVLGTIFAKNGVIRFLDGADGGIATLEQMLTEDQLSCPGQPIVLFGYSEGALVVDQTLLQLQKVGSPILQHVIGVGLIADPHRLGTAPYTYGTAHRNLNGLSRTFALYPAADLPQWVQNNTVSYCSDGDMVCAWDSGLLLTPAGPARAALNTWRVHTTYWESVSEFVGDAVADRAMSP
jgi:hypothetical protein